MPAPIVYVRRAAVVGSGPARSSGPPVWPFRTRRSIAPYVVPVSAGFDFDLFAYLASKLGPYAVYPNHVPEQIDPTVEVLPCFTYLQVYSDDVSNLSGPSGLVEAHYQIDAWSYQDDDIITMTQLLRRSLNGFRGMMGPTKVQGSLLHNRTNLDDPPASGSDRWTFHRVNEFTIFYIETIPSFS